MASFRSFLAGLGTAALGATVWGLLVEPRWLEVKRFKATVPRLPSSWRNKKVAVLSDFQIGQFEPRQTAAEKAVQEALRSNVDLALFAGDFVYQADENDAERGVMLLKPLTDAGIPTYAVLGNHDYGLDGDDDEPDTDLAARVMEVADSIGVRVLTNEHVELPAPDGGDPITLVGIGSEWANFADVEAAFEGLHPSVPRLVLLHHPDTFLRIPKKFAPLAVAGHTHGGQVRLLPFIQEIKTLGDSFIVGGWGPRDHGDDGNRLYVNRGIGFSWMPIRIGARPELTIIELIPTNSEDTPHVEKVESRSMST